MNPNCKQLRKPWRSASHPWKALELAFLSFRRVSVSKRHRFSSARGMVSVTQSATRNTSVRPGGRGPRSRPPARALPGASALLGHAGRPRLPGRGLRRGGALGLLAGGSCVLRAGLRWGPHTQLKPGQAHILPALTAGRPACWGKGTSSGLGRGWQLALRSQPPCVCKGTLQIEGERERAWGHLESDGRGWRCWGWAWGALWGRVCGAEADLLLRFAEGPALCRPSRTVGQAGLLPSGFCWQVVV